MAYDVSLASLQRSGIEVVAGAAIRYFEWSVIVTFFSCAVFCFVLVNVHSTERGYVPFLK